MFLNIKVIKSLKKMSSRIQLLPKLIGETSKLKSAPVSGKGLCQVIYPHEEIHFYFPNGNFSPLFSFSEQVLYPKSILSTFWHS